MTKRVLMALWAMCMLPALATAADDLAKSFASPPDSARPLTWWHWLDGNITRDGITADWEAIKRAGLGGAYLFNCGIGMPKGDVRFMQPEWLAMIDHTIHEAERLGLKFGVHNCDGFSQSGGPWMSAETSMKELTWTARDTQGPNVLDVVLDRPSLKEDFYRDIAVIAFPLPQGDRLTGAVLRGTIKPASLARLTDGNPQTSIGFPVLPDGNVIEFVFPTPRTVRSIVCRNATPHKWEEDFPIRIEVSSDGTTFRRVGEFTANWDMTADSAVTAACEEATGKVFRLTFHNPWPVNIGEIELSETARVHFAEAKATRLRSRGHGAERRHHDAYPGPDRHRPLAPELIVARTAVQNLTPQLAADGRLKWNVPAGRWRILRVGFTSNGHHVSPATPEGRGLECDKLDAKLVKFHLDQYVGKLLERSGRAASTTLAAMEVDSWECGIQNWTSGFERRFQERLGYDLLPFLPALLEGWIVDSADVTERALWDWRRFLADQFVENYFAVVARWAEEKKITFVGEPTGRQAYLYDTGYMRNPAVPMGEFWIDDGPGQGVRVDNKVASSLAHTTGKNVVAAEAYTAGAQVARWQNHPFSLKPEGDRAFCAGVNQFVFHTFAHQPYRVTGPGFTFASWGLNFNRGNTWWDQGRAWIDYLTRCNHMLRQGRSVADVLFFVGEDVPNRIAWRDELRPELPAGYDFDGCDALALLESRVENHRIVLPSGTEYRVLLLPNLATIRPALIEKILHLVAAGATVLGSRPQQSPSLRDVGQGDATVRSMAEQLWNGRVCSGMSFEEVFRRIGLPPDFEWRAASPDAEILYIHRQTNEADVYFVSNQKNRFEEANLVFRVAGRAPELWDPATGTIVRPAVYSVSGGRLSMPLRMEPNGSVFVVFREPLPTRHIVSIEPQQASQSFDLEQISNGHIQARCRESGVGAKLIYSDGSRTELKPARLPAPVTLAGPWQVAFPPQLGAPASANLERLMSLSEHPDPGVRFFSGTATYRKTFRHRPSAERSLCHLDLGDVQVIAQVTLNGRDLGTLWKPPFSVNVTEAITSGDNVLEIRVTNLWPNRLIGDAALPDDVSWNRTRPKGAYPLEWPEWLLQGTSRPGGRIAFCTRRDVYAKTDPLLPSGLLGPVTLRWVETKDIR